MRRNPVRIAVTVLTAAAMTVYGAPLALATAAGDAADQAGQQQSAAGDQKLEYADGEVLVLLADDAAEKVGSMSTMSVKKKTTKNLLDESGMKVAEVYDFGDGEDASDGEGGMSLLSTDDADSDAAEDTGDAVQVALVTSDSMSAEEMHAALEDNDAVEAVSYNYRKAPTSFEASDYSGYQWGLKNTGQNGGTKGASTNISAVKGQIATTNEQVVAVIDTGVDYTHADLKDKMWVNTSSNLAGTYGYDFGSNDDDPMDTYGHGTHCAGIIAAADDGKGTTGIDPNVKIMALKSCDDDDYMDDSYSIAAFSYVYRAMKQGVNVVSINCSWGGYVTESDNEIYNTIIEKLGQMGAVTCVSAGNDALDNDNLPESITDQIDTNERVVDSPSACESVYCVGVAATNENGKLSGYSSYGAESIDLAAPGDTILSTVPENTFNPSIYTSSQIDALTSYYQSFEGNDILTGVTLYVNGTKIEDGTEKAKYLSIDDSSFLGVAGGHSLKLSGNLSAGDQVVVSLPYTVDAANKDQIASMMLRALAPEGNDGLDTVSVDTFAAPVSVTNVEELVDRYFLNEISTSGDSYSDWMTLDSETGLTSKEGTQFQIGYVLSIDDESVVSAPTSIWIDDVAVSKSGVDSSEFGTYAFKTGTSMATPYVTGAVAAVAAMMNKGVAAKITAKQVIEKLYTYTKADDSLKGKVATGGYLNFEAANTEPRIDAATVSTGASTAITITGANLHGATVKMKEAGAEDSTYKDATNYKHAADGSSITFTDPGFLNYLVDIKVTKNLNEGGTAEAVKKNVYLVDGKSGYSKLRLGEDATLASGQTDAFGGWATDGTYVYGTDAANIYAYNVKDQTRETLTDSASTDFAKVFGDTGLDGVSHTLWLNGEVAYLNGQVYALATYTDSASTEKDSGYYKKTVLVKASANDEYAPLTKAAALPSATNSLDGYSVRLFTYNGSLYLYGGLNVKTGEMSTAVYKLDTAKGTWAEATSMKLPEGRALSQAIQVGNNVVITMGLSADGNCPANLVFDGSKWKVSKASLNVYTKGTVKFGSKTYSYFGADIGICKGGVQYIGRAAAGLGDTFTYDIAGDKFVAGAQQYSTSVSNTGLAGAFTYGDIIYAVSTDGAVSTAKTTSGLLKVTATNSKKGKVTGTGTFAPGAAAKVTVKAKKIKKVKKTKKKKTTTVTQYYVKSITVNGKTTTYKKNAKNVTRSKSFTVTANTKVKIKYGKLKVTKKVKKIKAKKASSKKSSKK